MNPSLTEEYFESDGISDVSIQADKYGNDEINIEEFVANYVIAKHPDVIAKRRSGIGKWLFVCECCMYVCMYVCVCVCNNDDDNNNSNDTHFTTTLLLFLR